MASPPRERAATASPQLRTPREERTYLRKNHNSPYRHSPRRSDVLVDDFSTLHMREERAWRELQDVKDAEQQYLHQQALAQAAAEHDRILKSAIEAAELEALKLERERKQKEEREHRALESERLAKAEREALERQRVKKELERQEEEQKKRAAEEREIQETQARLAEQKRKDETDTQQRKAEREAAERKIKEEADAPSASVPAVNPQPTPQPPVAAPQQTAAPAAKSSPPSVTRPAVSNNSATTASPLKSSPAQAEAIHKQYLTIHQNLKSMRKETLSLCKKNPAYGLTNIGDYRRKLATMMGQFTIFKDKNREVNRNIIQLMTDISKYSEPTIDITPFLAIPQDGVARPMPAPFVYLLNLVAKITLKQFCNESATSVDAVAIAAVTVFSKVEFKYQGTMSLFDILLAKFHAVCPILFGINGDERTASGRRRIGWWEPDGDFVDDEQHKNRMTGLAMGYGYLSLRDFSKSKMLNPFPPTNYWRALSYIANTPQSELQPTHFVVVRALVEGHVEKFLKFYGQAGVAALRKVLVELPKGAPPSAARDTAAVMPSSLQKTLHLTL